MKIKFGEAIKHLVHALALIAIVILVYSLVLIAIHGTAFYALLFNKSLFAFYPEFLKTFIYWISSFNHSVYQMLGLGGKVLSPVVGAPILEELEFRGPLLLFGKRLSKIARYALIVVSSVVFALCHGTPLGFMSIIFAVALISCWLVSVTRRIWPSMVFHGIYNSIVILLS